MEDHETRDDHLSWRGPDAEFWPATAGGVAIATSVYPFIFFTYVLLVSWNRLATALLPDIAIMLATVTLVALMAHFFALILTSIYGATCEKLFRLWNVNTRQVWVGAFVGGFVAFTITFPFILPFMSDWPSELNQSVLRAIGFALPATALAQAGAILGGRRGLPTQEAAPIGNWASNLPSFSIAAVAYLTVGISAVLCVLKLLMLDTIIAYLSAWMIAQGATLYGLLICERVFSGPSEKRRAAGCDSPNPAD